MFQNFFFKSSHYILVILRTLKTDENLENNPKDDDNIKKKYAHTYKSL